MVDFRAAPQLDDVDDPQGIEDFDEEHCRCFMRIDTTLNAAIQPNPGGLPFTLADVTYGTSTSFELGFYGTVWFVAGLPTDTFPFPSRFFEMPSPSAGSPAHMFYMGDGWNSTLELTAITTIRCFGDVSPGGRVIDPETESPAREFQQTFVYKDGNEIFSGLSQHFIQELTCFDEQINPRAR